MVPMQEQPVAADETATESERAPEQSEFCERSFMVFGLDNGFRRFAISLIQSVWFERLSMLVIIVNCCALGSSDPCDIDCKNSICRVVQVIELGIFIFFATEMLLKMVAMGVHGEKSYLAEPWNRLDFLIVIAGALEYMFSNSEVNLSSIRAFRVLRPLRAINRIPSLRLLVNLLLDILPMLGHVLILCFFIFFVFGTVAVQLWAGALRHRCFIPITDAEEKPPPFLPPYYVKAQQEFICSTSGMGMFDCSMIPDIENHSSMCGQLFEDDMEKKLICQKWVLNFTDCRPDGPNPAKGTINFDNIGYASIAIFQVISLEGWSEVMYLAQDSFSFWCWIYFIVLVMIGSYLAVNLCLVVIAAQFSVTKMREKAKLRQERLQASRVQGLSVVSLDLSNITSVNGDQGGLYLQLLNLVIYLGKILVLRVRQLISRNKGTLEAATPIPMARATICPKCRSAPASSYRPLDRLVTPIDREVFRPPLIKEPLSKQDSQNTSTISRQASLLSKQTLSQTKGDSRQISLTKEGSRQISLVRDNSRQASIVLESIMPSRQHSLLRENSKQTIFLRENSRVGHDGDNIVLSLTTRCHLCGDAMPITIEPGEVAIKIKKRTIRWTFVERCKRFRYSSRAWLKRALEHKVVTVSLLLCIVFNAIIMACEHHDQPEFLTEIVEMTNLVFTFVFLAELIIKLHAYGLDEFVREGFNVLDALIIFINVIELFSSGHGSGFAVLRLFRLVRIVKIVRFLPALQRQLLIMIHTVDHVATFFVLLTFFLYISALLGMNLFGCKFCTSMPAGHDHDELFPESGENISAIEQKFGKCKYSIHSLSAVLPLFAVNATDNQTLENETVADSAMFMDCPAANFDSLPQALFTVLQIFTQDDWAIVLKDGMHATSDWAGLYFITLVTLGNYIIFNLLVAILVEGFSAKSEEAIMKANRSTLASKANSLSVSDANEPEHSHMEKIKQFITTVKHKILDLWHSEVSNLSLFIFGPENVIRVSLKKFVESNKYQSVLVGCIVSNCFLIALEHPGIRRHSPERIFMTTANYIINFVFLSEASCKIIAYGLFIGPNTYLRSLWNALDFFLVCIAGIDVVLELLDPSTISEVILQALHVLRIMRALRPIRMVSKAKGLKIVIATLAMSIKPIGNIILICCFFFCIFGILGVQLFRGCFARCVASRHIPPLNTSALNFTRESYVKWVYDTIPTIRNKSQCLSNNLIWQTESYNFDSLPDALMSLFVFSTLDGWADITRNGVACVGVDQQPISNHNGWNFVYFVAFLLIVCFFAMNMFVGVVVNNFQKVQRRMEAELFAMQLESKKAGTSKLLIKKLYRHATLAKDKAIRSSCSHCPSFPCSQDPSLQFTAESKRKLFKQNAISEDDELPFWMQYPAWRLYMYNFFTHRYFEFTMTTATTINVVSMAIEFYNMPEVLHTTIKIMSYAFLVLIIFETVGKVVSLGCNRYLQDGWNKLDLSILFASLVGTTLEEINTKDIGINPSVVGIARIFRIVRIIKLWRAATGVRKLLKTISQAIPQVFNLSLLFLLLFFIYASLGVELYGRFECTYEVCDGLSRHANFQTFGYALLTLFRIFTGDDWNGILKDVLRMSSDKATCEKFETADGDSLEESGIGCTIVHAIAPFYFVSFVLLAQFVLINVVVAVLMRQIEDAQKDTSGAGQPASSMKNTQNNDHSHVIKETCFMDRVDFARIIDHQTILDLTEDEYIKMKLRKIANNSDDDGDEDEIESCETEQQAVECAEDVLMPVMTHHCPLSSQLLDIIDCSLQLATKSSSYNAITEMQMSMDRHVMKKIADGYSTFDLLQSKVDDPSFYPMRRKYNTNPSRLQSMVRIAEGPDSVNFSLHTDRSQMTLH